MSERLVIIPVNRELRNKIKEMKKDLSYSKYLNKLITASQVSQPELTVSPSGDNIV